MWLLGISAFYHDSAAALIRDGQPVAAAQEERFTRRKHDPSFPRNAVRACLEQAGIGLDEVTHIAFYDKPFLTFERLLETYLAVAPRGFRSFARAMPQWIKTKLYQKRMIRDALTRLEPECDWDQRLLFSEHHLSHAASAFYPSPFRQAVVLTMDGVGEWATTSMAIGNGSKLNILKEIHFPHSLGLLYSAFTYYTGFRVNSGEYKLMGLAPYGTPRYRQLILDELVDLKPDGSFRLNLEYFDYCTGLRMTNRRFHALFNAPPREPDGPLTQRDMDLAASVQSVIEEAVLRLTRSLARETGLPDLCLAGGVALNCVANGKVLRDGAFKRVWIQPAAGDAGGALGAALAAWHLYAGGQRSIPPTGDAMSGSYLGPEFSQHAIEAALDACGARYHVLQDEPELLAVTADALARGLAVGWFQGRMEFGPRALGNRSILADPRSPTMQKTLNLKIKYRESFRPFAPAVLAEEAEEWFDLTQESPYMLMVADVHPRRRRPLSPDEVGRSGLDMLEVQRSVIPAVTHVDNSARVQTVRQETNPRFHALLLAFYRLTGCPVLVNTSFNVRGEPIVATPEDAFRCFMGTELDLLVAGDCVLRKEEQDHALRLDHSATFDRD